ncbi:hypothetical protein FE275_27475 [Pseudomonas koreensis]|nr:hypothetical protein FE275_27475 [Pseudomonas koreensis]
MTHRFREQAHSRIGFVGGKDRLYISRPQNSVQQLPGIQSPVGAGLLAKASGQPAASLNDTPLS